MKVIFDGSFDGLLTAVFDVFANKIATPTLIDEAHHQPSFFEESYTVHTDKAKSNRVWQQLKKTIPKDWQRKLWCAYLSEELEVHHILFQFIISIFQAPSVQLWHNYGDESVITLALIAKKVEREKHRMKAFIRFEQSDDGLYYALIEPDYNVIPLISTFFKDRYTDQPWLIYDVRRDFGILYDTKTVTEVKLNQNINSQMPTTIIAQDKDETAYASLWKTYFKHTNIPARKNLKLHIQHVPKRYWRYLTEKKDELKG